MQTIICGMRAIAGRKLAIVRGAARALRCRGAVGNGTLALIRRPHHHLCAYHLRAARREGGNAGLELTITKRGRIVASQRRQIATGRTCVASRPCLQASRCRVLALLGTPVAEVATSIAKATRELVGTVVAALYEVAIAGCLIAIGRSLINVGCGLVRV